MHYNSFDQFIRSYGSYVKFAKDILNTYNTEPEDVYVENEADDSVSDDVDAYYRCYCGDLTSKSHAGDLCSHCYTYVKYRGINETYGTKTGEKSDINWNEIEVRRFVTCEEDITLPFKSVDPDRDIDMIIDDINIMRRYMFEITKSELSSYRAKNSEHIKFLLMNNFDKIKVFDPIIFDDGSGDIMHIVSFLNVYMGFAFDYFIEYDIEESQFRFRSKKFKDWKDLKNLISESKFIPLCIH